MKKRKTNPWSVWVRLWGEPGSPWELEATFYPQSPSARYLAAGYAKYLRSRGWAIENLMVLPEGRKPKAGRVR